MAEPTGQMASPRTLALLAALIAISVAVMLQDRPSAAPYGRAIVVSTPGEMDGEDFVSVKVRKYQFVDGERVPTWREFQRAYGLSDGQIGGLMSSIMIRGSSVTTTSSMPEGETLRVPVPRRGDGSPPT